MTSREYLNQLKRLNDLIGEEESDLAEDEKELEEETDLPTKGKEPFLKRIELQKRIIQKQKDFYPVLEARIRRTIKLLKVRREQEVLILRYVDFVEWEKIPKRMDCSMDAVWGVHKRALKHIQELV